MTTPQSVEGIVEEFRRQFNELSLKPSKNKMPGLERELIVDYWHKALTTTRQQAFEEGVKAEREAIRTLSRRRKR